MAIGAVRKVSAATDAARLLVSIIYASFKLLNYDEM
jgi:hypothetical protein